MAKSKIKIQKKKRINFFLLALVVFSLGLIALYSFSNYKGTFWFNKQSGLKSNSDYNVILITINCLRADHVGCYGYSRKTTPAIDALAKESIIFENAYSQAGYTLPSMISLITSLYPKSHGVFYPFKDKLTSHIHTLTEILNIHGYNTAWFSALYFPHLDIEAGFGRGFDYLGELEPNLDGDGKEKILPWIEKNKDSKFFLAMDTIHVHMPYLPLPQHKNKFLEKGGEEIIDTQEEFDRMVYSLIIRLKDVSSGSLLNDIIGKDVILANKELFDGNYTPEKIEEIEKLIPDEKKDKFSRLGVEKYFSMVNQKDKNSLNYLISLYDACIFDVDQMLIKPLISKLKELKIYDKTFLIITSEHGEGFGEHNYFGHGFWFHDELIHVPLIVKIPYAKRYSRIRPLVQSIDIMPTILEMTGIKLPHYLQGKSLLPLIRGGSKPLHRFIYGQCRGVQYIRSNEWKLIVSNLGNETEKELYHSKNDSKKFRNLFYLYPEVLRRLEYIMENHAKSLPDYRVESDFPAYIDRETRERIKKTGYW